MKFNVQHQIWGMVLERYLIYNDDATVQLDIYSEPRGINRVKAYIYALYVNEESRGKGIGKAMLAQAEEIAKSLGIEEVFLDWCDIEAPRWVLEWYGHQGYELVEFDKHTTLLKKKLS